MDELKAVCLALSKEALRPPSSFDPQSRAVLSQLEALLSCLRKIERSLNPTVAEYVFFPIRGLLQQNSLGDRHTELVFRCLAVLCFHAWGNGELDLERALQLLAVATFLLSPTPPLGPNKTSSVVPKKPASLRAAGFLCIRGVFVAAQAAGSLDKLNKSPTTAQIIALALESIDTEDLECQTNAIEALDTILVSLHPEHLALVLPSIVSKLTLFCRGKRHFRAKCLAIDCLSHTITNCIGDRTWDNLEHLTKITRTESWKTTTIEKLGDAFAVLKQLQESLLETVGSRSELLRAIYSFASEVYTHCSSTLSPAALEMLTEMVLATASQNQEPNLAATAAEFIKNNSSTAAYVQNTLARVTRELPSLLETTNEDRIIRSLDVFANAASFIDFPQMLEAFVETVDSSLPLSVNTRTNNSGNRAQLQPIGSIDNYKPAGGSASIYLSDLGLSLPLSYASQDALASVLQQLGKDPKASVPILNLLNDRLQALKMRPNVSLESVSLLWIASCVVSGLPRDTDVYDILAYCFDDLSSKLDVQNEQNYSPIAVAHTALAAHMVGEAALIQGESFREFLVDLVHPLFSLLGDSQSMALRTEAANSISKVAFACGYSSAVELAIDNKDYLVDGISLQLNTLNLTPGTLQALSSLINISGSAIIPYLDDVFASLFILMDHYHGYTRLVTGIMDAFRALITTLSPEIKLSLTDGQQTAKVMSFQDLLEELNRKPEIDPTILEKEVDLNTIGKEEEETAVENTAEETPGDESDDESDENFDDQADQAVEKWEYPVSKSVYEILSKIAGYCDRLMTHEDSQICMVTLQVVTEIVPFLAVNKEGFLPLVHKTWPEAVSRVFDEQIYVVEAGFRCLGAISEYAGDFVGARIDKLWPKLSKKIAPLLLKPWPRFSPERRVLDAFCAFFGKLVSQLDLSFSTLESALIMLRPALLRNEYPELKHQIEQGKSHAQDLLWLVMLNEPVITQGISGFHTILPVYKHSIGISS